MKMPSTIWEVNFFYFKMVVKKSSVYIISCHFIYYINHRKEVPFKCELEWTCAKLPVKKLASILK